MAVVNIEMSEYKAMEAKAEMLEEMRQTERKLHEEIKSIEQEKSAELKKLVEENKKLLEEAHEKTLKAYEEAKMKVVKTVRHETREHKLIDNLQFSNFTKEFIMSMNLPDQLKNAVLGFLSDRARSVNDYYYCHTAMDLSTLIDRIFRTETITSYTQPITTTHGLEEVKAEIYAELKAEVDEETERKLQSLQELNVKYPDTLDKNRELERELSALQRSYDKLFEDNKELLKKNEVFLTSVTSIKKEVEEAKWWNSFSVIKYLKNIIKEW